MPKVHTIGSTFVQVTKFYYDWGNKVAVRGWTQELDEPYRTSKPLIIRLPNYKALVLGYWNGQQPDEEAAFTAALELREITEDEFTEEKGWQPAPDEDSEESLEDLHS